MQSDTIHKITKGIKLVSWFCTAGCSEVKFQIGCKVIKKWISEEVTPEEEEDNWWKQQYIDQLFD